MVVMPGLMGGQGVGFTLDVIALTGPTNRTIYMIDPGDPEDPESGESGDWPYTPSIHAYIVSRPVTLPFYGELMGQDGGEISFKDVEVGLWLDPAAKNWFWEGFPPIKLYYHTAHYSLPTGKGCEMVGGGYGLEWGDQVWWDLSQNLNSDGASIRLFQTSLGVYYRQLVQVDTLSYLDIRVGGRAYYDMFSTAEGQGRVQGVVPEIRIAFSFGI